MDTAILAAVISLLLTEDKHKKDRLIRILDKAVRIRRDILNNIKTIEIHMAKLESELADCKRKIKEKEAELAGGEFDTITDIMTVIGP